MFVDTHCHISDDCYNDIDLVIKDNLLYGVSKVIISGCDKNSIINGLKYIKKYDSLYLTIGYHPEEVLNVSDEDIVNLENIIKENKKIVGIGEIGLDYHYEKETRKKQIKLFEKQLKIAEGLNLPVVIHSRDATKDTIECLKKYNVKGIIHCFSGSYETAQVYIKMGFKLGIGGVVTFKNSNLRETIRKLSVNDLVLETDSPYLTPEPYRGKINSSKYIPLIAECIANIYEISLKDVEFITFNNAIKIFSLH